MPAASEISRFSAVVMMTEACNLRCPYCDVPKTPRNLSGAAFDGAVAFARRNAPALASLKFFGGEPLLAFPAVRDFVAAVPELSGRYSVVTNGTLLTPETAAFFARHFGTVFVSLGREKGTDPAEVARVLRAGGLGLDRVCTNIVFEPAAPENGEAYFRKALEAGFREFNVLPAYFTRPWPAAALRRFAECFVRMAAAAESAGGCRFRGIRENGGEQANLLNRCAFVDAAGAAFWSDVPSLGAGSSAAAAFSLGPAADLDLASLDREKIAALDAAVRAWEKGMQAKVPGLSALHRLMDAFSSGTAH